MDLSGMLQLIQTPAGGGAAVYTALKWLDGQFPCKLGGRTKFVLSLLLSFLLPLGAHEVQVLMHLVVVAQVDLTAIVGDNFFVSQVIHKVTEVAHENKVEASVGSQGSTSAQDEQG